MPSDDVRQAVGLIISSIAFVLLVAALIARRHYMREKADVQGAWQSGVLVLRAANGLCLAGASCGPCQALGLAAAGRSVHHRGGCALYLAIEPYVRRRPHAIISCSWLMAGRLRHVPGWQRPVYLGILEWSGRSSLPVFFLMTLWAGDAPAYGAHLSLGARQAHAFGIWPIPYKHLVFLLPDVRLRVHSAQAQHWPLSPYGAVAIKTFDSHHPWIDIPTYIAIHGLLLLWCCALGL